MASQHIQAGLVGPGPLPLHILLPFEYLPIDTERRAEEDLRGYSYILQRLQRSDPPLLRAGLLR